MYKWLSDLKKNQSNNKINKKINHNNDLPEVKLIID